MTATLETPPVEVTPPGDSLALPTRRSRREEREFHRIRRWGLLVLGLQLVVLVLWSVLEASRDVLGADFAGTYHAWYLISHGVLDPPGWWQGQGIFIMWPLAIFGLIWPHPITLLVIQDLAIVGAEAVAFYWITDIVRARRGLPFLTLSGLGLLLLVADPWIYWSASWDYHSEALGTLFALLAARDLLRGRKWGWIWSGLTLLSGIIPATYLIGIGLGMLFIRKRRASGLILFIGASAWYLILVKAGVDRGFVYTSTRDLTASEHMEVGFATNPLSSLFHHGLFVFDNLRDRWVNALANIAPSGLLGVFTAPVVGAVAVVLGEDSAKTFVGSMTPSFQNLPIYIFVPIGTVLAFAWLYRRFGGRFIRPLIVIASANVIGWGIVWIPQVVPTWLTVSSAEASVLNRAAAMIPQQDGVVVSQGIVGAFGEHKAVGALVAPPPFQVQIATPTTWFVIAPYAGSETETVTQSMGVIDALASYPGSRLVLEDEGIWVFRLSVNARTVPLKMTIPGLPSTLPAGLFETTVGTRVFAGSVQNWHIRSNGTAGALVFGDDWLERVGRYKAEVSFKSSGPVSIQVWNNTTNKMLAERDYRSTRGMVNAVMRVEVTRKDPVRASSPGALYLGFGPFHVDPIPAYVGNSLEIRVLVSSGVKASVYSVSMGPVASA
jgi:hypothetical protein